MLTGISSDAELQSLEKLFSAGELLRITDLLQKTMAGLSKSLNLRTDAELCLLQLCNPALQLDAAALGARLSRLEEAVASGKVAISTASPAPPTAATPPRPNERIRRLGTMCPPPHTADDAPPWDDEISSQAPPAPSVPPAPKDAPIGFWTDLTAKSPTADGATGKHVSGQSHRGAAGRYTSDYNPVPHSVAAAATDSYGQNFSGCRPRPCWAAPSR